MRQFSKVSPGDQHWVDTIRTSPWGHVDNAILLAPGIAIVETPSHGGWHLDGYHGIQIAEMLPGVQSFLKTPFWWEEDCDWVIPCIAFHDEIEGQDRMKQAAVKSLTAFARMWGESWQTALDLLADKIAAINAATPAGWASVES